MQTMQEIAYRSDGTFGLASFPDCEGGHHGVWEGMSVFVVAVGTPDERIFKREDLGLASDYMNSLPARPPIVKVPTVSLCDEAVHALYEGRLEYA